MSLGSKTEFICTQYKPEIHHSWTFLVLHNYKITFMPTLERTIKLIRISYTGREISINYNLIVFCNSNLPNSFCQLVNQTMKLQARHLSYHLSCILNISIIHKYHTYLSNIHTYFKSEERHDQWSKKTNPRFRINAPPISIAIAYKFVCMQLIKLNYTHFSL